MFRVSSTALLAYNIYLYVMIALGVAGNTIVLIVFTKHPPRSTTDWFILFMTTCDFITSLITTPIYATFTNGLWTFFGNDLICQVHMFISQSCVLSSAFVISGLALDRYFKVCRPRVPYSKSRARNVCLVISLLTTILSTPCFALFENRYGVCLAVVKGTSAFVYYMLVFLAFIFSTGVVMFSYINVTRIVKTSEKNVARHQGPISRKPGQRPPRIQKLNRVTPVSTNQAETSFVTKGTDTGKSPVHVKQEHTSEADQGAGSINHVAVDSSRRNTIPSVSSLMDATLESSSNCSRTMQPKCSRLTVPSTARVQQHSDSLENHVRRKSNAASSKTTKIAFLLCTLFIVTWIPPWLSFILSAIPGANENITAATFMLFGRMTYLINNMANPFLYTWLNTYFRVKIKTIFCCSKHRMGT